MPTQSGSGKKNAIRLRIQKVDGRYEAEGKWVDRIGDKMNRSISWTFKNKESHPVRVRVHNFSPHTCPVRFGGTADCWAERTLQADGQPGDTVTIPATTRVRGRFTYEILVSDDAGISNQIDPELQIDGHDFHALLKNPIVIGVAVVALAVLAYWFFAR